MLRKFDVGSFVGLPSSPLQLPNCSPVEWANARRDRPFPEGFCGLVRDHCTVHIKTLFGSRRWRFEEAEAQPLRPGESILSRIFVWELFFLVNRTEGTPLESIVLLHDEVGTFRVRALSNAHFFLSLEAYGISADKLVLHQSLGKGIAYIEGLGMTPSRVDLGCKDLDPPVDPSIEPFNTHFTHICCCTGTTAIEYDVTVVPCLPGDSWTISPQLSCRVLCAEPDPLLDPRLSDGTAPALLLRVEHATLGPGTLVGWSRGDGVKGGVPPDGSQEDLHGRKHTPSQLPGAPEVELQTLRTYFMVGESVLQHGKEHQPACGCARVQFERPYRGLRRWNVPMGTLPVSLPGRVRQGLPCPSKRAIGMGLHSSSGTHRR